MDKSAESGKIKRRVIAASAIAAFIIVAYIAEKQYLPSIAVNQLAELTNTQVKVRSINFSFDGSVVIRGLQIKPTEQKDYDNTILRARKVKARFGLLSILGLKPRLKKIRVEDFTIDVQQDLDSRKWNIGGLRLAGGQGGGAIPIIRLKNGQLKFSSVSKGYISTSVDVPVSVRLERMRGKNGTYQFELVTAKAQGGRPSEIVGIIEPGHLAFSGGISSEQLSDIERLWTIRNIEADYQYENSGDYNLELRIEDLTAKEQKTNEPPAKLANKAESAVGKLFEKYQMAGSANVELTASGNIRNPADVKLNGAVECNGVSILYSVFPYFIEGIKGTVEFTENDLKINNLFGRHGKVNLTISGAFGNFAQGTEGTLEIYSRNMVLDSDLYAALFPVQKRLWDDFKPSGTIEFSYTQHRKPNVKSTYLLNVDLIDVNSTYRHFPYPLDNLTGNMLFDRDSIKVTNLSSENMSRQIIINGEVTQTNTARPRFDLAVDVNNIPLDETLAAALPPRETNLYKRFNPSGSGDGKIIVRNLEQDANKVDFTADLFFSDTVLRPPMLPLPITDIKANGIFRPDSIEFKQFRGMYAGQPVEMQGLFEPSQDGNELNYAMTLSGSDVQIDGNLLNLIPAKMRRTVETLNPSGNISYSANLNKRAGENGIDYQVEVQCMGAGAQPEMLDFALSDITGNITVNNNSVILNNVVSRPADGNSPGVILDGIIEISKDADTDSQIASASISLDANNFPILDKKIKRLNTLLEYDPVKKSWLAENFTGNFYGGILTGRIEVRAEPNQPVDFELQSGFDGVDLKKFLADSNEQPANCENGSCYSTGVMGGNVNVSGTVDGKTDYVGTCRIEIAKMQVGRISFIGRLLNLLNLTEPSDYVFDRLFFSAYIKNSRLNFEKLELSGSSLAFAGTGWMDMREKSIELKLSAKGPRILSLRMDLIDSVTSAISSGVLQIVITGNVYEPKVVIKPLPVIGEAIELIGTKKTPDK